MKKVKVKFCVDSGANIHSCRETKWMDPVKDLGLLEGEWEKMDEEDKYEMAQDWANNHIEVYFEEEEI